MYVYKKTDKEQKNPIYYRDGVKYKTLWNKAEKIEELLNELAFGTHGVPNLMFDGEDHLTRTEVYIAIDCMKAFKENLKLKSSIQGDE